MIDKFRESQGYNTVKNIPETVGEKVSEAYPTRMLSSKRGESLTKSFMPRVTQDEGTNIGDSGVQTKTVSQIALKTSKLEKPSYERSIPETLVRNIYAPTKMSELSTIPGLAATFSMVSPSALRFSTSTFNINNVLPSSAYMVTPSTITNTKILPKQVVTPESANVSQSDTKKVNTGQTIPSPTNYINPVLSAIVPSVFGTFGVGKLPSSEGTISQRQQRISGKVSENYLRNLFFEPSGLSTKPNVMVTGGPRTFKLTETNIGQNVNNMIGRDTTSASRRLMPNSAPYKKIMRRITK